MPLSGDAAIWEHRCSSRCTQDFHLEVAYVDSQLANMEDIIESLRELETVLPIIVIGALPAREAPDFEEAVQHYEVLSADIERQPESSSAVVMLFTITDQLAGDGAC